MKIQGLENKIKQKLEGNEMKINNLQTENKLLWEQKNILQAEKDKANQRIKEFAEKREKYLNKLKGEMG